jgi:S1-C subfamily serine protease
MEMDTANVEQALYREARQAGFQTEGGNLFEPAGGKAEFAIAGAVTDLKAEICNPFSGVDMGRRSLRLKGSALIEMEWQVYSGLERRVVATIRTNGGMRVKEPSTGAEERMIHGAFVENAKALLASPEFRKVLAATAPEPTRAAAPRLEPYTPLRLAVDKAAKPVGIAGAMNSVVLILSPSGHGSGFLVSTDGYILTNEHVVGGAREVRIRWADGSETRGTVERADRGRDVALIKTDPGTRKPLLFRTTPPVVGETVLAVGAPLDIQFQGTVTRGIVSTPNRMLEGLRYVQSDVTVNQGNSGGPLLDEQGRIVAVTVALYHGGLERPTGINLFVPIDDAARFLNVHQ